MLRGNERSREWFPIKLCYITGPASAERLQRTIERAIEAGVELIQIRNRALGTRGLLRLTEAAVARASGSASRVVVNDRLDVALAAGAAGVHLGQHSMPARRVRAIAPPGFLVGVSCHSIEEAANAESAGADYLLLGPVFETPSKLAYGPPLGLEKFGEIASQIRTPILALGGVTPDRVKACADAGAAGIAAIRMFEEADSLSALVSQLRANFEQHRI